MLKNKGVVFMEIAKPLVWVEKETDLDGKERNSYAATPIGRYEVFQFYLGEERVLGWCCHGRVSDTHIDGNFEDGQKAAQDHFNKTVLSCVKDLLPVAEICSAHGDPESFGERELTATDNIQKFPYKTKLYVIKEG